MSTINSAEYVELKQAIYREYSRSYDEDRQRFVSAESLLRRIRWALEPLSPGQRLLDLGCGSGELLLEAHRQTGGVGVLAGLDLSPEMLSLARVRADSVASLVQGNSLDGLPFQDGSFHLVTSLNLLQELPRFAIQPLLEQVRKVLKPGGNTLHGGPQSGFPGVPEAGQGQWRHGVLVARGIGGFADKYPRFHSARVPGNRQHRSLRRRRGKNAFQVLYRAGGRSPPPRSRPEPSKARRVVFLRAARHRDIGLETHIHRRK